MPAELDRSCFMHGNVAALTGDDALPRTQDRIDNGGIGLGPAYQKLDQGPGAGGSLADLIPGFPAESVGSVAFRLQ